MTRQQALTAAAEATAAAAEATTAAATTAAAAAATTAAAAAAAAAATSKLEAKSAVTAAETAVTAVTEAGETAVTEAGETAAAQTLAAATQKLAAATSAETTAEEEVTSAKTKTEAAAEAVKDAERLTTEAAAATANAEAQGDRLQAALIAFNDAISVDGTSVLDVFKIFTEAALDSNNLKNEQQALADIATALKNIPVTEHRTICRAAVNLMCSPTDIAYQTALNNAKDNLLSQQNSKSRQDLYAALAVFGFAIAIGAIIAVTGGFAAIPLLSGFIAAAGTGAIATVGGVSAIAGVTGLFFGTKGYRDNNNLSAVATELDALTKATAPAPAAA